MLFTISLRRSSAIWWSGWRWLMILAIAAAFRYTWSRYMWTRCSLFLDGYEEIRSLALEEAAALAPMIALCHAEFALTEADYFLGVLHSPEKARVATDNYLVGHAQWFRSAAGEKLARYVTPVGRTRAVAAGTKRMQS